MGTPSDVPTPTSLRPTTESTGVVPFMVVDAYHGPDLCRLHTGPLPGSSYNSSAVVYKTRVRLGRHGVGPDRKERSGVPLHSSLVSVTPTRGTSRSSNRRLVRRRGLVAGSDNLSTQQIPSPGISTETEKRRSDTLKSISEFVSFTVGTINQENSESLFPRRLRLTE